MRVLVMFDLPVVTAANVRDYRLFRKYLIKSGFLMMQESIYIKLVPNVAAADAVIANIKKNKPIEGLIQALKITEKQYSKMEFILGESHHDVLDSDERLVIL
ncbi:MAG: CRISPR-associated endonuclease Cas2 [Lachnospiraceae bacterium]|nr:CRISPR-associated endonuclease Cas2 [Lachnospiraceae bacterium]